MTEKLYDSKCFDLAEAFLEDEDNLTDDQRKRFTHELAVHIQEAIGSWLSYELGVLREGEKSE
jgi:hypothetical protein